MTSERLRRASIISVLGITQIFAWGGTFYLMAVLAAPIVADTGWPLSLVIGALSAGLLAAGVVAPRVGRAIQQHGGRPVLAFSSLMLAIGLGILAVAPVYPVFLVGWLVIGIGMGSGLYDAAFATLGRMYGAAARPAITALTLWGGFASTVCWPLSAYLVIHLGWRGTCLTYAGIYLALSLPLLLLTLPDLQARVEEHAGKPIDGLGSQEWPSFLLFAVILVICGTIATIVSVHLVALLGARGAGLEAAVALGTLIGPAQVAARVVEMAAGGRHHPMWTLTGSVLLIAAGIVMLWLGWPILAVALVLYSGGNGIFSIARGTLPLALFGARRYPVLMGMLGRPSLIAQAASPILGAVLLDQAGAEWVLAILAALAILNLVLTVLLWLQLRRSCA